MIRALLSLGLAFGAFAAPPSIPPSILGDWRITKILPTQNVACWDETRAKSLLNSTLRYYPDSMRWKGGFVPIPEALTRTIPAEKYADEYKVSLAELGIRSQSVVEIDLQHEDADITGSTTEVPGDTVLLAGPGRIVVSACGVFFSAVKIGAAH